MSEGIPAHIQLDVVTPDRLLLSLQVDELSYRTHEGYVGIMPGHIPMLTTLEIGELSYKVGRDTHYIAVARGFVEVLPDRVIVLADSAELATEIDRALAQTAKEEAEARMRTHTEEHQFLVESALIEDAVAKLSVAARHR